MIYSTVNHQRCGWVGLKKSKHDDVILEWPLRWYIRTLYRHACGHVACMYVVCIELDIFWTISGHFFAKCIKITLYSFEFLIYKYYPCLLPYSFANCFILAFCVNWWMPYVGAGIALLDNTSTTLFRSLITKCVDPDEVGYGNTGYDVFKGVIQN